MLQKKAEYWERDDDSGSIASLARLRTLILKRRQDQPQEMIDGDSMTIVTASRVQIPESMWAREKEHINWFQRADAKSDSGLSRWCVAVINIIVSEGDMLICLQIFLDIEVHKRQCFAKVLQNNSQK